MIEVITILGLAAGAGWLLSRLTEGRRPGEAPAPEADPIELAA
jgi:hypothetical protein